MTRAIDLNADVGEGTVGDLSLLGLVTSANVACGFHAGDPATMRAVCSEAVRRGVAIGAHVGYRDRRGFGRRELDVASAAIESETAEQILALGACAREVGGRVAYVKPHGALYHRASIDPECAAAIVSALRSVGDRLAVLAFPGSALLVAARTGGLAAVPEGFADRAYTRDGSLVPRGAEGAVLRAHEAASQALSIAREGAVTATDGTRVGVEARSLCVHGDAPGALVVARRVAAVLEAAAVELRAFA